MPERLNILLALWYWMLDIRDNQMPPEINGGIELLLVQILSDRKKIFFRIIPHFHVLLPLFWLELYI